MNAITIDNAIVTSNDLLNDLFTSGGMQGMLGTIWLILCAMVFGGVMDAIGLQKLSQALLAKAQAPFNFLLERRLLVLPSTSPLLTSTSLLYYLEKCLTKPTAIAV